MKIFVLLLFSFSAMGEVTHPFSVPYECNLDPISAKTGKPTDVRIKVNPEKNWVLVLSPYKNDQLNVANLHSLFGRYYGTYEGTPVNTKKVDLNTYWPSQGKMYQAWMSKVKMFDCHKMTNTEIFNLDLVTNMKCMDKEKSKCLKMGQ